MCKREDKCNECGKYYEIIDCELISNCNCNCNCEKGESSKDEYRASNQS